MYDGLKDTVDHINNVRSKLNKVVVDLLVRMVNHDRTKTESPEREGFDNVTVRLKDVEYGSEEYKQVLKEMKPIIDHHYQHNSHHPEYYQDGISGMNLLDLIEMVCDWKAAGERHKDGDIVKSIEINAERFGISDQLKSILLNTVSYLEWI